MNSEDALSEPFTLSDGRFVRVQYSSGRTSKSLFCLILFALSLLAASPSSPNPHFAKALSSQSNVNLVVYPRPPVLPANNGTYSALVLEFVNEITNLPAVPTKNTTIYLSSSNIHVGNVSSSIIFPAGQIFVVASFHTTYYEGSTTITAMANSSMPSVPGKAKVTTSAEAGNPDGLQVFANPSSLPAVSGFTSNIVVEAVDSGGNPAELANPVNVALSSSNLTVGSLPVSLTIQVGQSFASANFSATSEPGSSVISASANGFLAGQANITTFALSSRATTLSVQVGSPQLISNGQQYPNIISVSLLGSNGKPALAPSNVTINLNISSSSLSPGSLASNRIVIRNGTYSSYVSFLSSDIPGTTEIFASAPNYVSGYTNLTTVHLAPLELALYSVPTAVLAGGSTYSNIIAVQLQSVNGTPASAMNNVFVELGTGGSAYGNVSQNVIIPSGSDLAFVNLTTTSSTGTMNVTAIASGLASGSVAVSSVFFPTNAVISLSATSIPNTSTSTLTLTASSDGAALPGATVAWTIVGDSTMGRFTGSSLVTNSSGIATAVFHPGSTIGAIPIVVDFSKPDYLPNSVSLAINVYSQQIYAVLTSLINPVPVQHSSNLSLLVTSGGSPLANASIQWSATSGSIDGASLSTNGNGIATALFAAGPNESSVQIQAKVTKSGYFTYLANLTVGVFLPTFDVVNYGDGNILGGSNSSVSLQAESSGSPISNASVSWQIVSGPLTNLVGTRKTNESGYSFASFVAQKSPGLAEIRATISYPGIATYTDDIRINVTLLKMTAEIFESHPSVLENYKSAFSILFSSFGHPISNASITWRTTGGNLTSSSAYTNSSGYAVAVFESGSTPGNMSVEANVTKSGYYNYTAMVYFTVVVPSVGGTTGNNEVSGASGNFLTAQLANVIPVWTLIVGAGGAGVLGYFFYRRRKSAGYYYEEE